MVPKVSVLMGDTNYAAESWSLRLLHSLSLVASGLLLGYLRHGLQLVCTLPQETPTLWRGVPVASIQKSFGLSGRDWKPWKKLPIRCKFCTYRFIRYSSTCYGKVRINPLMANTRNPDFFAPLVANAAWFVVVRPCYLNRDLLSGPKGN